MSTTTSSNSTREQPQGTTQVQAPAKKPLFTNVSQNGRKPKLAKFFETHQDVYQKILMFIEQGVYDYVAAEAMGVTGRTWNEWLKIGEKNHFEGRVTIYSRFFLDVRTAQARGRLLAELEVRRDDPKFFLRCGPGKTRPGRPGWTENIVPDEPTQLDDAAATGREDPSIGDLAATLVILEQLGMAVPTDDMGQGLLAQSGGPPRLDYVEPAPNEVQYSETKEDFPATTPSLEDLAHMDEEEREELLDAIEEAEEAQGEKGWNPEKELDPKTMEYDDLPDMYS